MRIAQLLITLAAIAPLQCVVAQDTVSTDDTLPPPPTPKNISRARAAALYAPRPKIPAEVVRKHLRGAGVCVLYVNPDGTVSRAEMLRSTGQPILDKLSVDTFSQWRFVPGTFKKVKIPVTYTGNYPKPEKT